MGSENQEAKCVYHLQGIPCPDGLLCSNQDEAFRGGRNSSFPMYPPNLTLLANFITSQFFNLVESLGGGKNSNKVKFRQNSILICEELRRILNNPKEQSLPSQQRCQRNPRYLTRPRNQSGHPSGNTRRRINNFNNKSVQRTRHQSTTKTNVEPGSSLSRSKSDLNSRIPNQISPLNPRPRDKRVQLIEVNQQANNQQETRNQEPSNLFKQERKQAPKIGSLRDNIRGLLETINKSQ